MHSQFAVSIIILKFGSGSRWLRRLSIISTLLPSFHCDFCGSAYSTQQQQQQQQQQLLLLLLLLTAIELSPGGSSYFTCIQNMKLVTTKFKSGGLHEKHVVAT